MTRGPASLAAGLAACLGGTLAGCDEPGESGDDDSTPPPADDDTLPDDDATPPPAPVAEAGAPVRARVGVAATLDGGASTGAVDYAWDFGDGNASPPSADGAVSHIYQEPGHFTAVLTVRGPDGHPDTDATPVTVVYPPLPHRPPASSTVDADFGSDRLFVVLPDFDRVAVVDRSSGSFLSHLSTCGRPRALSHARRAVPVLGVACEGDDAVEFFDTDRLASLGRVALPRGSAPRGVVVSEDGSRAWVALRAVGEVAEVSLAGAPTLVARYPALPDPRGLALAPDHLVVSRFRSPDEAGQFGLMPVGAPGAEVHDLPFDPGPDSDTTHRGVPNLLAQVVVSPDGRRVVFPSLQANIARGAYRDGLRLTFDTTVRAVLSQAWVDPYAGPPGEPSGARKVFDNRDYARAAAFSPEGDWLYVVMQGAETVEVLDAVTFETAGSFPSVGHGPDGAWVSPDGAELWVSAGLSREVVAYSLADLSRVAVEVARVDLLGPLPEALSQEVLLGAVIFHRSADPRMSRDGYISCASCHPDGEHDGRTWDFTDRGEGLRNTVDLLGRAGTGHGPIHWSANFDEVQDFENDIRNAFLGSGFLDDADWEAGTTSSTLGDPKAGLSADLDALAAYVESLASPPRSPFRADDGSLSETAVRGEAVFLDPTTGCAGCHPPPEYTDSAWLSPAEPLLHDVGTLGDGSGGRLGGPLPGVDTPTLRGVWATGPYLHDGSAPTLREVLRDRNPSDGHGVTSHLSDEEVDDLVAFLLVVE